MTATREQLMEREHFVYRCFDAEGVLLYVGCTTDVKRRLREHRIRHWHADVARVEVGDPASYLDARAAEWRAIQTENPAHSSQSPESHERRHQAFLESSARVRAEAERNRRARSA